MEDHTNSIIILPLSGEIIKKNIETFMEIERDYPDKWTEDNFCTDLPEKWNLSRYAVVKDKIYGFLIASKKENHAHLHRFMVSNECRGKGIGNILYSDFEDACKKYEEISGITLNVLKNNNRAIMLYEKLGYKEVASNSTHKTMEKTF